MTHGWNCGTTAPPRPGPDVRPEPLRYIVPKAVGASGLPFSARFRSASSDSCAGSCAPRHQRQTRVRRAALSFAVFTMNGPRAISRDFHYRAPSARQNMSDRHRMQVRVRVCSARCFRGQSSSSCQTTDGTTSEARLAQLCDFPHSCRNIAFTQVTLPRLHSSCARP
jgi:hypothetical protein